MRRGREKLDPKAEVEAVGAEEAMAVGAAVDMVAEVEAEATGGATAVHARHTKSISFRTAPHRDIWHFSF
jgi:hypothetical protein